MTDWQNSGLITEAARLLRDGQLVSFPTETVYGLGAHAQNAEAINRLYRAKGRPSSHPVIVHLHDMSLVANWAVNIPDCFEILARAFWPGPMTLVLKRATGVLDEVTGGQDTVAIRVPNHPVALALLKEFGDGVVAPSANKFGRLSPTSAQDVRDEFGEEIALVLDGGACLVGIESTIVDLSSARPRILRPGMLSEGKIFSALGMVQSDDAKIDKSLTVTGEVRVPGSLESHYAPVTPVSLISSDQFQRYIEVKGREGKRLSVISFESPPADFDKNAWIHLSREPELYAQMIYASLRGLDKLKGDLIVVEAPPDEGGQWLGIRDRLDRAAH